MKNNAPTAAQRQWREAVRELGSVISLGPAVIHHPVGRTGMHNKVHIGHWWLIPLTDEEHKALHNGETFGYESRKEFEKRQFEMVYFPLMATGIYVPGMDIVELIQDYHL